MKCEFKWATIIISMSLLPFILVRFGSHIYLIFGLLFMFAFAFGCSCEYWSGQWKIDELQTIKR